MEHWDLSLVGPVPSNMTVRTSITVSPTSIAKSIIRIEYSGIELRYGLGSKMNISFHKQNIELELLIALF